MKLLILQGPGLNLLGLLSKRAGNKITLDKVNSGLRRHNRNTNSEIKILQTHKVYQALNFLQRNRNWADGIIIAPQAWALYEQSIKEVLFIISIPTVQVFFPKKYGSVNRADNSIFTSISQHTITESPEKAFILGYDFLHSLK